MVYAKVSFAKIPFAKEKKFARWLNPTLEEDLPEKFDYRVRIRESGSASMCREILSDFILKSSPCIIFPSHHWLSSFILYGVLTVEVSFAKFRETSTKAKDAHRAELSTIPQIFHVDRSKPFIRFDDAPT